MVHRARSSWLLTALLVLGLIAPSGVLASGPCCCLEMEDAQQIEAPQEVHNCCAMQGDAPDSCDDEPADEDDDDCRDECDCPGQCCFSGKAPVGVSALVNTLPAFDPAELARPSADRIKETGPVFELVHPPRA